MTRDPGSVLQPFVEAARHDLAKLQHFHKHHAADIAEMDAANLTPDERAARLIEIVPEMEATVTQIIDRAVARGKQATRALTSPSVARRRQLVRDRALARREMEASEALTAVQLEIAAMPAAFQTLWRPYLPK